MEASTELNLRKLARNNKPVEERKAMALEQIADSLFNIENYLHTISINTRPGPNTSSSFRRS